MTSSWFAKIRNSLINQQFQRREWNKSSLTPSKKIFPCITISREPGSGGCPISHLVAKRLKMKLYDKEFVELIAKSAKKRKEVVEALDERSRNMIEGIIESVGFSKNKFSESSYFRYLCRIILSLTHKSPAVFLGRGANFIVPHERSLNIRIIAPLKVRIDNAVKYEKKNLAKAKADIRKAHFDRKDFIKRYFLKNTSNANYYDLVINTQNVSLDQAVSLIIRAFKEKFPT